MVASYKKLAPSSLKLLLKRLRFWYNNRLLTLYRCPEFMFVSGVGSSVRTVNLVHFSEMGKVFYFVFSK